MPLHAEHPAPVRELDRLGHPVRVGPTVTTRPSPRSSTAWWWWQRAMCALLADRACRERPGRERDLCSLPSNVPTIFRCGFDAIGRHQVLLERAAERHVEDLQAAADRQHRHRRVRSRPVPSRARTGRALDRWTPSRDHAGRRTRPGRGRRHRSASARRPGRGARPARGHRPAEARATPPARCTGATYESATRCASWSQNAQRARSRTAQIPMTGRATRSRRGRADSGDAIEERVEQRQRPRSVVVVELPGFGGSRSRVDALALELVRDPRRPSGQRSRASPRDGTGRPCSARSCTPADPRGCGRARWRRRVP